MRILVASDGTAEALHAITLAHELSQNAHTLVRVLSVYEPMPNHVTWPGLVALPSTVDFESIRQARQAAVRTQIASVAGSSCDWPIDVVTGSIGPSIADALREWGADLLITGRGRYGVVERIFGEEHLLKVLRVSSVPVLAAEEMLVKPPRNVLVGMDFGENHRLVAEAAAPWIAPDARVTIAHVRPQPSTTMVVRAQWMAAYQNEAVRELEALRSSVNFGSAVTVAAVMLDGPPGEALVDFALAEGCDLVVAGAQGLGFVHRLVVGSVTAHLLRHAPCSLLAVPSGDPWHGTDEGD
jgi:nucleotide-binding universal stress UspA family protein